MTVVVPLSKPIQAHGEELAQLTLRPPTGRDLRTCGMPFRIGEDASVSVDAQAMARMISALAAIPPSGVDHLSAADWQDCMVVVLSFFGTAATPS